MSAPLDTPQLVKDLQKGDPEAFTALVQRFQKEIYCYMVKHIRDPEDAHDLTQQVFLKAWLHITDLKETTCFRYWLYKIAQNVLKDNWRRKKIISVSWENLTAKDVMPDIPGPEDCAETRELIKLTMARLSPKLRLCLLLYTLNGFSPSETARAIGIKEASVGTYISMARRQFRSMYHHLENEHVVEKHVSI
ncbi:MAG: RNA polymerase sigma factor [Ktedonobacteraceae bacterium]